MIFNKLIYIQRILPSINLKYESSRDKTLNQCILFKMFLKSVILIDYQTIYESDLV